MVHYLKRKRRESNEKGFGNNYIIQQIEKEQKKLLSE